jgi:N-sulfoglucosamine sulfohydrolase
MRYLAALAALVCAAGTLNAADAPRKNVLLLIADDLGLDLACYGNTKLKLPNVNALATRGTHFSHAFATVSSCSPSRACMFTGMYSHMNGQYGLAHGDHNTQSFPHVQSLPRVLNPAGYHTGIVGKVHVLPKSVYPFTYVSTDEAPFGNRDVGLLARKSAEFLAQTKDKPFFLVVAFGDPHRVDLRTGVSTFKPEGFGNGRKYEGIPEVKYDPKDVIVPYHLPDQPEVRAELADYYQSASRMDHGVGLVLEELKKAGHADDTLILFVSDNGIPFPGAKTTLYDSGVHLPLLISSPAQKKRNVKCAAMASFVDLAPTIYDWTGVKAPAEVAGRSLLPVLEEENPKGWDMVFGSHQWHEVTNYYPMRMLRTRHHKYILNIAHKLDYPFSTDLYISKSWQGILKRGDKKLGERDIDAFLHRPHEELFDLDADPNELKNVSGDPKYAAVLKEMRAKVKEWQLKTKDRWSTKQDYE